LKNGLRYLLPLLKVRRNKMLPYVSIALATYNVEEFVRDSLECIVNQTLKNIEIICIDDGSTDNTLSILNEYAERDNRIIVVAKPRNEGLAVARNESLALAKGKYIAFVDGDDLMDLGLFKKAYELAEKERSDLVLWDYVSFYDDKEIIKNKNKTSLLDCISINDKQSLLRRPAFTWTKLMRIDAVKKININFPKGLTRQDIPVHWKLILQLEKISLLPEKLSYYRQQPDATTYQTDERLFDLALVMDITGAFLKENNFWSLYKDTFLEIRLNLLFGMYDKSDISIRAKALGILEERLGDEELRYISNKNKPLRWQARNFYLGMGGLNYSKLKYLSWCYSRKLYRKIKSFEI
jgi:glycosyltransferase involved in cell wall biosynthesis